MGVGKDGSVRGAGAWESGQQPCPTDHPLTPACIPDILQYSGESQSVPENADPGIEGDPILGTVPPSRHAQKQFLLQILSLQTDKHLLPDAPREYRESGNYIFFFFEKQEARNARKRIQ